MKNEEKEAIKAHKQKEKNFIDYGLNSLKKREKAREKQVDKILKSIYK